MSNADDTFWRRFGMILAVLTLFGFVVAFIARDIAADAHDASMNHANAVAARIAPMGQARVGDPSKVVAPIPKASMAKETMAAAAPAGPMSGEQIYNTTCVACHGTGVAGAPKKGDAAAWAPRIALGEDALVKSVMVGKGAMPPKAGNPSLSDEQARAAIKYLTGSAEARKSAPAADAAKEVLQKTMAKAKSMAAEATTAATDAASTASSAAKAALGGAMAAVTPTAASAPATTAGKPGDEVYNAGCVACHATGAANAPKLTDKAAWEPRAASGFAALLQSVTKGKGAMPPRGGLSSLSDADVENAIRYMLKEAGVAAGS